MTFIDYSDYNIWGWDASSYYEKPYVPTWIRTKLNDIKEEVKWRNDKLRSLKLNRNLLLLVGVKEVIEFCLNSDNRQYISDEFELLDVSSCRVGECEEDELEALMKSIYELLRLFPKLIIDLSLNKLVNPDGRLIYPSSSCYSLDYVDTFNRIIIKKHNVESFRYDYEYNEFCIVPKPIENNNRKPWDDGYITLDELIERPPLPPTYYIPYILTLLDFINRRNKS
jgi:hypothetical protein